MDCASPLTLFEFSFAKSQLPAECFFALTSRPPLLDFSVQEYLPVFLLTCLLEFPVYAVLTRHYLKTWRSRLLAVVVLNLTTHPLIYFGFPRLAELLAKRYAGYLSAAEFFAFGVEAVVLYLWAGKRGLSFRRAAAASLGANLFSWWLGGFVLTKQLINL